MVKRYYKLIKDWKHPFVLYKKDCVYSSFAWANRLGHDLTAKEFEEWVNEDDRFKQYFEEVRK